ncbi:hypothetical protein EVJ58_g5122 [Rhodofomes roseus]|uniref:Bud22 domain-containing protein n=1 Tax=Rhodofomes roseus TaxID=34475 RepID=A0A4Y9YHT4_9APHY|nr:hypothetical protein EVJ58_g5122 [Rhodofomes roseus]
MNATRAPLPGPRGVKRKRGKEATVDPGKKIQGKLHHGLKAIRKVAKKEKIFEIQKLIKKSKDVAGKKQENVDYDEQRVILKALDPEHAAHLATKTKIGKDKFLSQNDFVKAAVEAELSSGVLVLSEPGTTASVVESRFLSSKRMAAEIQKVLQVMKDELNGTPKSKPVDAAAPSKNTSKSETTVQVRNGSFGADHDEEEEASEGGSEVGSREEDGAGWESGDVVGSDAGDGWESGSVDDTADNRERVAAQGAALSDGDDSDTDSSEVSDASSSPATKRRRQLDLKAATAQATAKDLKGKSKASAAESTFLPSLSVGFTRGDSDASDWSDAETNVADGVRKNRRGQRARRAIWEKKYGKNANHVKKAHEGDVRDGQRRPSNRADSYGKGGPRQGGAGPDARQRRPGPGAYPTLRPFSNGTGSHDRGFITAGPPLARAQPMEDKPLHPSWEAKKRLKEKQNPVVMPAQGKKITFA